MKYSSFAINAGTPAFAQNRSRRSSGVEPMSHVFPVHNVFREDVVTNGDEREEILANAPEAKEGAFVVPKTFD